MRTFTLSLYRQWLKRAASEFEFVLPREIFPLKSVVALPSNTVVLRHDVDFDLDRALRMAREEANAGVRSAYYFRFCVEPATWRIPSYSPFFEGHLSSIREIHQLGHEIGLHYEWTQFESLFGLDPVCFLRLQADAFKRLTGLESIGGVSHGSAHARATGRRNTAIYEELNHRALDCGLIYFFYQEMEKLQSFEYYTDSGGFWHGESIHSDVFFRKSGLGKVVLVHPDWWTNRNVNLPMALRTLKRSVLSLVRN